MKPILLFLLFSLSTLHAQWIMDVGDIRHFYAAPELMKKNKVVSFLPVTHTHHRSLPKDLRLSRKWKFKTHYWVNKEGFVFGAGDMYHGDTIFYVDFQQIPDDSTQWMMCWDSIRVQNDGFHLYHKGYRLDKYLTIDQQGKFITSKHIWYGENNSTINMSSWRYHYTDDRLDSIVSNSGKFIARYQYNDQNQLIQVLEYSTFGYSDSLSLQSTITYEYRKDGLPKAVRQTFLWYTKYWSVTRFKWRLKK